MLLDFFRREAASAPETKASATGPVMAWHGAGRVAWSPRDTVSLTRSGFSGNPVGFRSVKLIAEAAAALPLVLQSAAERFERHPILSLLRAPNAAQGRAELFEALFGQLLLSGNGYLEAVGDEEGAPVELHVLRSDRMKVVPGSDGWPVAYEYAVGARKHRFEAGRVSPICHIKAFHPQDDHYGFSPMQAAAMAIDVHNSASRWSKALLDNAARPSGAIVYRGSEGQGRRSNSFAAPSPVEGLFLDLPLMRGDEVPHAPHLAVLADPWPGTVAVYEADADEDYVLNSFVTTGSVIGVTESALGMVPSGRMDRGLPLLVRMLVGDLESVGRAKFLNGGNFFAIGDGVPDNWELFQARTAELVGEQTYQLSNRLRGQLGTERSAGSVWPQGSWVVAVNEGISQLELAARLRNVARHYRIGPATQTYSHETYGHSVHAFKGIGLRPYAPVHLRIERGNAAGSSLSWIRRTRIDGDTWETPEVPVGEDYEKYLVRVRRGAQVLRSQEVGQPFWTYSAGAMSTDGAAVGDIIEVAQISARYGVGKFASTIL